MTAASQSDLSQPATLLPARRPQSRWWALVVLSLAQLMVIMDGTIIIVALPSAQQSLGISDTTRQWVVTAYTLAFGGLLLLGGRLADRLGQRTALLIAMIGFAAASAVSGAAVNGGMLIASRAAQGAFGALLVPSATSFIALLFPVAEREARARALGIFSAVAIGGGAFGFILGGLLTDLLSWRWCLYINIPLGVIAVLGAILIIPNPAGKEGVRLDVLGALLSAAGMVALVYGLGEVTTDGWGSPTVLISLAAAVVLLVAFVVRQRFARSPLLPLRVVTERNRAGAFIARALAGVGQFALFLILTYQFQRIMGFTPLVAGFALVPLLAANAIGSVLLAPRLLPRILPRFIIVPGMLLFGLGLLLMTQLTTTTPYVPLLLGVEILFGLGGGLIVTPSTNTALTGISAADVGIASGMASASQQVGASIGTALLNSIAATATAAYLAMSGPTVSLNAATVHGYTVAATWGAGIVLVGAVVVAILINANPRQLPASGAPRG